MLLLQILDQIEFVKCFLESLDININENEHFDFFRQNFFRNATELNKAVISLFIDLDINIDAKLMIIILLFNMQEVD